MEFGKRLMTASVAWTAAVALACVSSAGLHDQTMPWLVLACSTAMMFSGWAIVEHVIRTATMDAARYACDRIESCNDEAIEQVAYQIAAALRPAPECPPVKLIH